MPLKKILLIDDDQIVRDVIKSFLAGPQYEFHEAWDGDRALRWLSQSVPDLVITDIYHPGPDGLQIVQHARNVLKANFPILVITAISGFSKKVLASGASAYLTKPFTAEELKEIVDKLLPEK